MCKKASTEPLSSSLSGKLQEDAETFAAGISQEHVQIQMGKYLQSLKNRKKK